MSVLLATLFFRLLRMGSSLALYCSIVLSIPCCSAPGVSTLISSENESALHNGYSETEICNRDLQGREYCTCSLIRSGLDNIFTPGGLPPQFLFADIVHECGRIRDTTDLVTAHDFSSLKSLEQGETDPGC